MVKIRYYLFIIFACSVPLLAQAQKIHPDAKAIYYYQQAAEVRALQYQAFQLAEFQLEKNNTNSEQKPLAVVLDVDETVLNNSPHQAYTIQNYVQFPTGWTEWTAKASADTIPGVTSFLKKADRLGYKIFYITNRSDLEKAATIKNLEYFNLPQVSDSHVLTKSTSSDKTERRNSVLEHHTISLLIGDNLGDFDELFQVKTREKRNSLVDEYRREFGTRFIILPNSMYGEWEKVAIDAEWSLSIEERFKKMVDKMISFE